MQEERYRAAVNRARGHLSAGGRLNSVLATLRADGLSEIECIEAIRELLDVHIGRARALVYLSPAFAGRRDEKGAGPESLIGALQEVNEIAQRSGLAQVAGSATELAGDPEQQLGDLRAALALALDMVVVERDSADRRVLIVPTDGEILDEVRRLRGLSD
ncbi:hypothetical protein ACGF5C_03975 [Micromonospora sp. NPDC047620]|uniref:hypothetical protein n=1 Tax=Micromonospora sp. NPDC047620 TaxID=3364251 RepID=UPI003718FBB7